MATDDDAATLRERVRELEATVAQQQDTIEQLMPSRRAILAGGAGVLGGAALTGQASAQSAAGQVGTSGEPVDVEGAEVNADLVNAEAISITNVSTGTPSTILNADASPGSTTDQIVEYTNGVDGATTTILSANSPVPRGGIATVLVRESSTSVAIDRVLYGVGTAPVVIDSVTRGAPTGRTYEVDSVTVDLLLSMDSATTANVAVVGFTLEVPAP